MPRPRHVTIISPAPPGRVAKLGWLLRRRGVRTRLIAAKPPASWRMERYFDEFQPVDMSPQAFRAAVLTSNADTDLFHVCSQTIESCQINAIHAAKKPLIVDPYDCFIDLHRHHEESAYHTEAANFRHLLCLAINHADGLVCRDLTIPNFMRVNRLRPTQPRILFADYCWGTGAPPGKPGEPSVMISGSFAGLEVSGSYYRENGVLLVLELLIRAGIRVGVIRHHIDQVGDISPPPLFPGLPQLEVHASTDPLDVLEIISGYNFGAHINQRFLIGQPSSYFLHGQERRFLGARLYDHLDCCQQLITSPEFGMRMRAFRGSDFLVPAGTWMLETARDHLARILAARDRPALAARRFTQTLDAQSDRLLAFYTALPATRSEARTAALVREAEAFAAQTRQAQT